MKAPYELGSIELFLEGLLRTAPAVNPQAKKFVILFVDSQFLLETTDLLFGGCV
jgi:hypothetical protein